MYSRKGIRPTSSLSSGLPVHGSRMMAFSGCLRTWLALVSITMTLDGSRLRYEISYIG